MPRPIQTFENFVGQRRLVRLIKRLVAGSRQLGKPFPSLLLLGPTGCGKTTLAEAIAAAMGIKMRPVFASEKVSPRDLYGELQQLSYGDFLFIDEVHSLVRDAQQSLYTAEDRNMIPAQAEKGRPSQAMSSVAEHTLVLATNYPGQLHKGLRSRMLQLSFDDYTLRELIAIAKRIATELDMRLSPQAARRIAETSQGSPRRVLLRLQVLRRFAPSAAEYTFQIVQACLACEGVDQHGLTRLQRDYLRTLAGMPKQRCGLDHLAARLGPDGRFIREEVERFLVERGCIEFVSNNVRRLTQKGHELLLNFSL